MVWHEPLELQYWFVNVFAGSPTLFYFIAFMAIGALCGTFRMNNLMTAVVFIIFLSIMTLNTGGEMLKPLFILTGIIFGIVVFLGFSRMMER